MLLNHDPASTWIAIMTEYAAYFDDSGHPDDQEAVLVAGFISSETQWLLFEREWQAILDREGIEIFHMTDFEKNKVWPQHKKDAILRRLVSTVMIRTVKSISHGVLMKDYRETNDKYPFEETIGTPYALSGRTVAKSLNTWKRDHMQVGDKLLVFFEDGTKHKGDFMDAMERDQLPCPAFIKKSEATPLQAADWLAWEVFHAFKTLTVRPSLAKLKIPINDLDHGIYEKSNLEKICQGKTGGKPLPLRSQLTSDAHIAHHSSTKKPRKRTIF
jgi:Protein of unknown function (DUF3800)